MWTMAEKPPIGSDGPYYTCLCGIHVRTGSNIVAAIVLVIGFFELFKNLLMGGLFIIIASLMIFAHIKANPWAYWPYLGVNGCLIAFNFILTIACVFMGPNEMAKTFDIYPKSQEESYTFYYFFIGSMLVIIAISLWFWYIVYRAFVYIRDVISRQALDKEVLV